jgi:5-methylthioribose kinase
MGMATWAGMVGFERCGEVGSFVFEAGDVPGIGRAWIRAGVLRVGEEVVSAALAGQGNMNRTLRVRTSERSLIVKQSFPWVAKYPQFAAPWDRIVGEHAFYERVRGVAGVGERMPAVIHFEPRGRWMVLEDLGEGGDYTDLYRGATVGEEDLRELAGYLCRLHAVRPHGEPTRNMEMRVLNHAHLFEIPFRSGNGLDLEAISPGLGAAGARVTSNRDLVERAAGLGRRVYLGDGPSLLHGDFFPGSVVRGVAGPRVIDPEFSFDGRAEIDEGIWLGHLVLAGQGVAALERWRRLYRGPEGHDEVLAVGLAGVEIVRRLIGYAQLPLGCSARGRIVRLEVGAGLVARPAWDALLEGMARVEEEEGKSC